MTARRSSARLDCFFAKPQLKETAPTELIRSIMVLQGSQTVIFRRYPVVIFGLEKCVCNRHLPGGARELL